MRIVMEERKQYKISVVTAVYNVEEYLGEMIESILSQTIGLKNIQLILVDDGSQDHSGKICDKYATQYPENIKVIHKDNGGVSSARNEGLKYVIGEYINFTDADDMLEKNALEKMYQYLEKNKDKIDIVAIPMKYYGSSGTHPLDYKFKQTKIVDLEKQYDYIQLAINSTLVKKECFHNRYFDKELSYAEDAQLVIDILLEKMRYGIVCGTSYLYRKRDTEDSAIDLGRSKYNYYLPYIKKFILHSIKNANLKKKYIPRFVQYTCMYDLQWRFNNNPIVEQGVLNGEEIQEYKKLILKALQYIKDKIIWEQRYMNNQCKLEILSLKKEHQDSNNRLFCEFIEFTVQDIIIEGTLKCCSSLIESDIILKVIKQNQCIAQYKAERKNKESEGFFQDEKSIGFRFCIKRNVLPSDVKLQFFLHSQQMEMAMKYIWFGKFFPLTNQLKRSYLYEGELLLTYSENMLCLLKTSDMRIIRRCERRFQREMLSKKDKKVYRGWVARKMYMMLKPLKRNELWLISDRLSKADDNGEAFFTYMNTIGKNHNIDTYFVLDKNAKDYKRLSKIGKVVPYHTTKHKILSLLCDKKISSQGDEYVYNRFFDLSYLFGDIQHRQKFVFLQHGITKDDSSKWLKKTETNISLFVTATNMEYQSIFQYPYGYTEKQVKCTGFPRYDYLYHSKQEKNIITFMPTWRLYLTQNFDDHTDSRTLVKGFENSSYCKMYRQVLSDSKLFETAKKLGYQIKLMLHPAMPRECIPYFHCDKRLEILDKNTRYRDLYADSKLIITDYSSAVFDFAYLKKPVLYYQQDVDEFFSGNHVYRKGYFDYENDGFGEVEYTAEALVEQMIAYMENGCQLKAVYRKRIEKTFPYCDRGNCRRVYEGVREL